MPKFAANLSTMYTDRPFIERFAAAARDGFLAVECQYPYGATPQSIREQLDAHRLRLVLFNAPSGDASRGERGIASLPGRDDEFDDGIDRAIVYARMLDCPNVHVLAGCVGDESQRPSQRQRYIERLTRASARLAAQGITTLIEPINPRDMPGYLLNHQAEAHEIRALIGNPMLKVQMDFYHCQIVEGDLTRRLCAMLDGVGHVQIAGVPDRHEPDRGEINYPWIFEQLDAQGYSGWIGCEYFPAGDTSAGLGWIRPWVRAK